LWWIGVRVRVDAAWVQAGCAACRCRCCGGDGDEGRGGSRAGCCGGAGLGPGPGVTRCRVGGCSSAGAGARSCGGAGVGCCVGASAAGACAEASAGRAVGAPERACVAKPALLSSGVGDTERLVALLAGPKVAPTEGTCEGGECGGGEGSGGEGERRCHGVVKVHGPRGLPRGARQMRSSRRLALMDSSMAAPT